VTVARTVADVDFVEKSFEMPISLRSEVCGFSAGFKRMITCDDNRVRRAPFQHIEEDVISIFNRIFGLPMHSERLCGKTYVVIFLYFILVDLNL
jgi:hypothetical protein